MLVKDIMTSGVDFITPVDSIKFASEKMRNNNIGILPVFDDGEPVGIITDRDIAIRVVAEGKDPSVVRISDAMTHEVYFCNEYSDIAEASSIMEHRKIRRVLVKNSQDEITGVLSLGDIALSMTNELAGEVLKEVSGSLPNH